MRIDLIHNRREKHHCITFPEEVSKVIGIPFEDSTELPFEIGVVYFTLAIGDNALDAIEIVLEELIEGNFNVQDWI